MHQFPLINIVKNILCANQRDQTQVDDTDT